MSLPATLSETLRGSVPLRRTLTFGWHIIGILLCYWLSFQLRFDFSPTQTQALEYSRSWVWALVVFIGVILGFRLYRGVWRYFTFRDCVHTALAFGVGSVVLAGVVFAVRGMSFDYFPRSILVINLLLIVAWEITGRSAVRLFREFNEPVRLDSAARRVLIVGDGENADQVLRSMPARERATVCGIVTEEKKHRGSRVHGVTVYTGIDSIGEVAAKLVPDTVITIPPHTSPGETRKIIELIKAAGVQCEYRSMPSLQDITGGKVSVSTTRRVEIEDLLSRPEHKIDVDRVRGFVESKRIMITGAGGSIGSEMSRQLLGLGIESLTLFESSETQLFQIERELVAASKSLENPPKVLAHLGDMRSESSLRKAIRATEGVDVIFHAAAYKHVDLTERNPVSCFHNNVVGTSTAATVAEAEGVGAFILISTDKAVRPTSLMGASKRIAERCLIERPESGTEFKAVRFGNVLGSSGSVVPIFRDQIAKGGPVTVTSPDVTRFFMTIPEAVELVIMASAVGEDRSILVLEMGNPVKIDHLARQMIELSGFVPDKDIAVEYIGLKSGEKEFEELLTDDENVVSTAFDRIWVVRGSGEVGETRLEIGKLFELIDADDGQGLREYAQALIPEATLVR